MKKLILSVIGAIIVLGLIQLLVRPISLKSRIAVVGNTISQLAELRGVLERFERINHRLPRDLNELAPLASELGLSDALKYHDVTAEAKREWLYFPAGKKTSKGEVVAAAPVVFTADNSEIEHFNKTGHRVVLFSSGKIEAVVADEIK